MTNKYYTPELNQCIQVKWFYHAAETEGTAKGGGRVEDIKTPGGAYCFLRFLFFVCLFVYLLVFNLQFLGHEDSGGFKITCYLCVFEENLLNVWMCGM